MLIRGYRMNAIERLIEHFGSQTKTAKALNVSQPSVSYWLRGTFAMEADKAFLAQELTGGKVMAWELCPKIPNPDSKQVA